MMKIYVLQVEEARGKGRLRRKWKDGIEEALGY